MISGDGILPVLDCGGCTLCCQRQRVPILWGDRPKSWFQVIKHEGQWVLRWKENGDCWYLDRSKGCTIWADRPQVCRAFDCRLAIGARPDIQERGEQLLDDLRAKHDHDGPE